MTAIARNSPITWLSRRLRDPTAWADTVDIFAILVALSLPWSTSLVAIFATALLVTMVPFLDLNAL
jgi:O-antigen ligase